MKEIKTAILVILLFCVISTSHAQEMNVLPATKITVETNTQLKLTGGYSLVLESDETNGPSFINSGVLNFSGGGEAKVERYLSQTVYHYISSPVSSQSISPEFVDATSNPLPSTVDFYKFDEPNNLWRNIKDGSGNLNTSFETEFVVNRGYAYANSDANYTRTFSGTMNQSNQSTTLTRSPGTGSEGWNLVGNPFPASIAINSAANTIYNFLADNAAVLDDNYEAVYLWDVDDYMTVSQASAATLLNPSQGFFVKAESNGVQLLINANNQKHTTTSAFYKNQGLQGNFIIGITGPQGDYNQTYISFIPGTTKGRDTGYDARKLKGNPNIALFSKLVDDDGGDYIIQSLPIVESQQVYLGLDAMQPGMYQFGNVQMIDLPYQSVLLEDKVQNVYVDLNLNPSYSFTTNQTGMNIEDRFLLHFGGIITHTETMNEISKSVSIFSDGNFIYLQNLGSENQSGPCYLYNMACQMIKITEVDIEGHSRQAIPTGNAAGIYLVRFVSTEEIYTQKVILK